MKPQPFTLTCAIILLSSVTSYAGNGYFKALGRNLGYGISDGYHAQRYCLPDDESCSNCSAVQQPMTPQPMTPQPMTPQPMLQQPMLQQQPMMQPLGMQPPIHAPALQGTSRQFPQDSYPVVYPVTHSYRPWYRSYAPGYSQPATPAVAIPNPRPALHW